MTRRLSPLLVALVGGIFRLLHLPVLVLVLYSFNSSRAITSLWIWLVPS